MADFEGNPDWPVGPSQPRLAPGQVHVWLADCRSWNPTALQAILSEAERQRAARYRRPEDRTRAVVARGILRRLLGAYVDIEPERVNLIAGPSGKPALAAPEGSIRFSVSHSRDLVLYAIASDTEVGVDVEYVNEAMEWQGVMKRIASEAERVRLESLPAAEQRGAFYGLWTTKEACVKCSGEGLAAPLEEIETSLPQPAQPWLPVRRITTHWLVHQFSPVPIYAAALAVATDRPPEVARWSVPADQPAGAGG